MMQMEMVRMLVGLPFTTIGTLDETAGFLGVAQSDLMGGVVC